MVKRKKIKGIITADNIAAMNRVYNHFDYGENELQMRNNLMNKDGIVEFTVNFRDFKIVIEQYKEKWKQNSLWFIKLNNNLKLRTFFQLVAIKDSKEFPIGWEKTNNTRFEAIFEAHGKQDFCINKIPLSHLHSWLKNFNLNTVKNKRLKIRMAEDYPMEFSYYDDYIVILPRVDGENNSIRWEKEYEDTKEYFQALKELIVADKW